MQELKSIFIFNKTILIIKKIKISNFNVLNKLGVLRTLIFMKRIRHRITFELFISVKMAKHEKCRVLLTFDDLSNVKNTILAYNSTHFRYWTMTSFYFI